MIRLQNSIIRTTIVSVVLLSSSYLLGQTEYTETEQSSQSTYGGIGLIEMPSARFSNDGEFAFGLSYEGPYRRLYSKMQFFPWMEAVVRYTEGTFWAYRSGMVQTWKDKGIDVKFKLLEETTVLPEIALGIIDIGGTGGFASEYIAASKKINSFDYTIGLGWGRFGGVNHLKNPLGWVSDGKKIRGGGPSSALSGTLNLGRMFSGNQVSVFSGIEYFTPVNNLSLKIEYDTSDYSRVMGKESHINKTGDIFKLDSRINYALNYRLQLAERDNIDISLGFLRGNTFYANFAVHSNLNKPAKPKFIAPTEIINTPYLEPYQTLNKEWQEYLSNLIIWQMGNVGIVTHRLIFNGNELQAEISQGRFREPVRAIDLASRVLANNSPKNINQITIINIDQGIETLRATIDKKTLIDAVKKGPLNEDLLDFNTADNLASSNIMVDNSYLYPNFYWQIKPNALGTLQHQAQFYFWQLEALLHAEYSFKKGLYLSADVGFDIANNYERYTYHVPDGKLHHVRQDRRLYLTGCKTCIRRLAFDYLVDLHPNIKAKVSAGYLEWMYGGIGGEVIYMPHHKKWALGADLYYVKQREFDQKFSFRDYQTITGYISYYQDLPIYDMRMKISAGKFLGKDKGFNVDLSRRFDSGAKVGAIVAQTDCDAACVGEGSFSKWIYFELPMDLFFIQSETRGKSGYSWSPLTKDAGSKVEPSNLYEIMTDAQDEVDSLRLKPWSIKKIFSGFSTKKVSRT